ncbi:MAG: alpha-E domain-containing protein, partial [Pseudomonadota bacterium]|nr:alpha-E domain-containing protein [Pseudomonadota bacterium]
MLSKVAERVYWAARYLERVESTARMLSIYDTLLFDLPRQVNLGWYNLIVINSLEQDFNERYSVQDERNVVKFLVGDDTNPSSIVTSLKAIRENIRTTRDVIPADTWELVNELSQYVQDHLQQGINRRDRHEFLGNVISACQQIIGLWQVNMPRDSAWEMLKLGQNLERADMTTRNLDAATAAIMQIEDDDFAVNSQQIIWGNVLRSLSADQPYRRAMR